MNTLPALVGRALIALGVMDAPATPPAIVMEPQERKRGVFSKNRSAPKYDADSEFIALDQASTTVFDFKSKTDPVGRQIAVMEGAIYTTNGRAYKLRSFSSQDELNTLLEGAEAKFARIRDVIEPPWRLREAKADEQHALAVMEAVLQLGEKLLREGYTLEEAKRKLIESFDNDDGGNSGFGKDWNTGRSGIYGSGFDPVAEYTPLMGGPWNKQLYLSQYLEQHAKAFEAYNHNPIAKQLIDLTTAFVFGRGVDYTCVDISVDEVLREFVDRTEYFVRLEQNANDLWWSGNQFKQYYDDTPENGQTDFRCIDPSTILEIVTDPEDIRKVYYYHNQYSTQYQNLYSTAADTQNIPTMKYIVRHIPADQIKHTKINCSEWEKYGRSDLFSVLGWLKRLKDLLNARVVKGLLEAAFVWDIEIATDNADVDDIAISVPDPYNPGSTFIHNHAMQLKPQGASVSANGETMPDVDALKSIVATGVGTPKEFIGETSRMSKSGSLTATEPGTKRYERRQRLEETIILDDFDRVIWNASEAGDIDLNQVLLKARSVLRLASDSDEQSTRTDVAGDMQDHADTAVSSAKQAALNPGQPQPKPNELPLSQVTSQEAFANITKGKQPQLNDAQKRRVAAIIKAKKFARELVEITFPSIASEDRSAKLKDLALAEAMEWLPKSITAALAAKELNITTFEFATIWKQIVAEAAAGLSIAHVFGQDNKHVPVVAQAQTVQEEMSAMQPSQQQFEDVPVPPAQAGMKQVPTQPGQNGATPGNKANTGDSKVNNRMAPKQPNPTAKSHGYSNAANNPMTNEGKGNIKGKESASLMTSIYAHLLREAVQPINSTPKELAQYILRDNDAVEMLEEAVRRVQEQES